MRGELIPEPLDSNNSYLKRSLCQVCAVGPEVCVHVLNHQLFLTVYVQKTCQ